MPPTIARPSVASLYIQARSSGTPLGTATGFVVERNDHRSLITNWHVVTGTNPLSGVVLSPTGATPNELLILHNRKGILGQWVGRVERLVDAAGHPKWREHAVHRKAVDVVSLELTDFDDVEIFTHDPWADGPGLAVGIARGLSIIGFPFGLTGGGGLGVWVQGTIATEPDLDYDGLSRFLVDSRTRQGQSGSPVLAYHSGGAVSMADGSTAIMDGPTEQFIGVYSGRIHDQSDLGFVWKPSLVREIVDGGVAQGD